MSSPLISVIVTSYNYAQYIGQTINSILSQTYDNLELIIADDHSTDNSLQVIKSFKDRRITLVSSEKNEGASRAYNKAYSLCRGKYMTSVDSDDYIAPSKFERQVRFLEDNPDIDICSTYMEFIRADGSPFGGPEPWVNVQKNLNDPASWVWGNEICHSTVVMRKTMHDLAGQFNNDLIYAPDYDFWLRCMAKGARFHVLPEKLLYYRRHGENISIDHMDVVRNFWETAFIKARTFYPYLNKTGRHDVLVQNYRNLIMDSRFPSDEPRQQLLLNLLSDQSGAGFEEIWENNIQGAGGTVYSPHAVVIESFRKDLAELAALRSKAKSGDEHISHKAGIIVSLETAVKQKAETIKQMEAALRQKDKMLRQKDAMLRQKGETLSHIFNSHGWRVLLKYYRLRESALPMGSKRRKASKIFLKSVIRLAKRLSASSRQEARVKLPDESLSVAAVHVPVYARGEWPMFSIVSVLYGKEKEVPFFLESFARQDYEGKFEIIFVNDFSWDKSVDAVLKFKREFQNSSLADIKIIQNDKNMGNCYSRNVGIERAQGDIISVIDADCMVNKYFLKKHAEAYFYDDCDAAIGPLNLETNREDPFKTLDYYQNNLKQVEKDAKPQDPVNKRSFLNCVTRNFSIKRNFIKEPLFDELFSYSSGKNSGFGWEDVEMGYRLYKRGAKIKYVSDAFSVHISHPSTTNADDIPTRSLKNFRRLFDKHPDLFWVARRWSLETYAKICSWLDAKKVTANEDREYLNNRFQRFLPNPFIRKERPLKILSYPWHCAHQYEIYKLPYEFTLVTGLGTYIAQEWDFKRRPLPGNVEIKDVREIKISDHDFAILHFDENILSPENTNGIIGPDWGMAFKWFYENVKLPKVAICHGTPQFYGQYDGNQNGHNLMEIREEEREKFVKYLKDILVITNSYQAQREWGFEKSKVIWHGFDPAEFPYGTFERKILMLNEKSMSHRPHYNGYILKNEVFSEIPEEHWYENISIPEPNSSYGKGTNDYAYAKFSNYTRELGKYSIYFNPTLRSPMPRTRSEAMMCGCAIVTAGNHDVELFIKNGANGFYSDDQAELREYLLFLLRDPKRAREIGMAGRKTAMDIFNHDRFLSEWDDVAGEILNSNKKFSFRRKLCVE